MEEDMGKEWGKERVKAVRKGLRKERMDEA